MSHILYTQEAHVAMNTVLDHTEYYQNILLNSTVQSLEWGLVLFTPRA